MLEKALRSVSLVMARMGGGLLVAAALLVSLEVILRKTGIVTFSVAGELSSYALAIGASWAFAFVLFERAHVRIDIVSQRLSDRPRALLNILAVASLAAVGLVLTSGAFGAFLTSLKLGASANTTLATPLFIPQGFWTFGLAWFTLIALYRTVTVAAALLRGDLMTVEQLAGAAATDAEADKAAADARTLLAQ